MTYRYDKNRPISPRRRYIRWSYSAEFTTPIGKRDKLELEAKYRPKLYERQVEVGKKRVPRHDHKWTWSAIWSHALRQNLALELGYEFEWRTSNDPDKRYQAHQMIVGFVYRW